MKIAELEIGRHSAADRRTLTSAITLIALGLSIFVLDTWGNLFVRMFVGLFWTSFLLFLNGPSLVRALRALKTNGRRSPIKPSFANYERRTLGQ